MVPPGTVITAPASSSSTATAAAAAVDVAYGSKLTVSPDAGAFLPSTLSVPPGSVVQLPKFGSAQRAPELVAARAVTAGATTVGAYHVLTLVYSLYTVLNAAVLSRTTTEATTLFAPIKPEDIEYKCEHGLS
jgi:hypothetical protein